MFLGVSTARVIEATDLSFLFPELRSFPVGALCSGAVVGKVSLVNWVQQLENLMVVTAAPFGGSKVE